MRSEKGFTLIELAVVLAIIAVLAAVLTPVITSYVDQAKLTRAKTDCDNIAAAMMRHYNDTGKWPIYADASGAQADSNVADTLIGTGSAPTLSGTGWSGVTTVALQTYLNTNVLGTAVVPLDTPSVPGGPVFRGPYLQSIQPDPWSNAYYVTAKNLKRSNTNSAYVACAGPNSTMETSFTQARGSTFTVSGDDIVVVIR